MVSGPQRYRVDAVAAAAGVSIDVVRAYQSRGLLAPPAHEGRVAWYDRTHLDRLRRIQALKERGWSLRAIGEALASSETGEAGGEGLKDIVARAVGEVEEAPFNRSGIAERTGVPPAVLRSFEASGVLRPRPGVDGVDTYTAADVDAVRALLALIGTGVPMEDFMAVADVQIAASREVAEGAVALFSRYVRDPLLAQGLPEEAEADRLVASLRLLVETTGTLLAYNFSRMVLEAAQDLVERDGTLAERAALAREAVRRMARVPKG